MPRARLCAREDHKLGGAQVQYVTHVQRVLHVLVQLEECAVVAVLRTRRAGQRQRGCCCREGREREGGGGGFVRCGRTMSDSQ